METTTMGRVTIEMTVENLKDLWQVETGELTPEQVRRVTLTDALVDTGTTMLSLPAGVIRQLGLAPVGRRRVTTTAGVREATLYEVVRVTVQGRDCRVEVLEVADGLPALLGQVPLELLDLVVDPVGRRLIGNPAHGGEQMVEMY